LAVLTGYVVAGSAVSFVRWMRPSDVPSLQGVAYETVWATVRVGMEAGVRTSGKIAGPGNDLVAVATLTLGGGD
jgi:hypothetical protein